MKILFVAAEGAPFAKTGGLGDVIGALPKSLVKNGHEVAVILPYYDVVSAKFGNQVEDLGFFYTNVGWRRQYVGIKKIVRDGVTFFFIDNEQYFNRGTVYGEWDDGERFGFFQMAALELMEKVDFIPTGNGDVIDGAREQWNDGSNTLCIRPGVVVTYDRNYVSNQLLRDKGIKVIEITGSELVRGRGGPRCMSQPLFREDI
mgnify:CR=1 FL=1